jgi:hypothetical protein
VRDTTQELPFAVDPAGFLVALEVLADDERDVCK